MYTSDAKMMCIRAYLRLKSLRKTACLLGVSKSTIQRWIACNPVSRRRREARKATQAAINRILEVLETNPFETPHAISRILRTELGIYTVESSVFTALLDVEQLVAAVAVKLPSERAQDVGALVDVGVPRKLESSANRWQSPDQPKGKLRPRVFNGTMPVYSPVAKLRANCGCLHEKSSFAFCFCKPKFAGAFFLFHSFSSKHHLRTLTVSLWKHG
jgi:hypothetical protein